MEFGLASRSWPGVVTGLGLLKASALGVNMLAVSLPQLLALATLTPTFFGHFSIAYLAYAFGTSLLLSVTCEPWIRDGTADFSGSQGYFASTALISVLAGLVGAAVVFVSTGSLLLSLLSLAAVLLNSIWFAMRYRGAYERRWTSLFIADGLAIVAICSSFVVFHFLMGWDFAIQASWAAAGLAALLAWSFTKPDYRGSVARWVGAHRQSIYALLPESLLLDLGSVGTPAVLYPVMGPAAFGTYRAVSNSAFPIRILLTGIRPVVARNPSRIFERRVLHLTIVFAAATIGGMMSLTLVAVGSVLPETVLGALRLHWLPAGIFIGVTGLGQVYYLCCRFLASGSAILVGRFAQTGLVVSMPTIGWFIGGLNQAVWGFTLSAALSAIVWFAIAYRQLGDDKSVNFAA